MAIVTEALVGTKSLYIPRRGLLVELPQSCAQDIKFSSETGNAVLDPMTREQLKNIMNCPILRARYPHVEDGEKFMNSISPQWRDGLLKEAKTMGAAIKTAFWTIGKKSFATILYGSVAKNLVKSLIHPDPSNVDIVVIGDFDTQEKLEIMDLIRPTRQEITTNIKAKEMCRCESVMCYCYADLAERYLRQATTSLRDSDGKIVSYSSELIERMGIILHPTDSLRGNGYGLAREYVASCARPLYDPENIWGEIENEAILYSLLSPSVRKKIRKGKPTPALDNIVSSLQGVPRFEEDRGAVDRLVNALQKYP